MTAPTPARARSYYAPGGDPADPGRGDAWVITLPPTRAGAIAARDQVLYTAPGYEGQDAAPLLTLISHAQLLELSMEALLCQARLRRAARDAARQRPRHRSRREDTTA